MIPARPSKFCRRRQGAGFTLIELVLIIVVIGILATLTIVKYQDITSEAKESACKSALGGLRSGISTWYSKQLAASRTIVWPPIDTLRQVGRVIESAIPPNPFQGRDLAPDSIVLGVTKGVVVGTRGGWAYNPNTGDIWPNTNTLVSTGSGCSSSDTYLNENTW